MPGFLIISFSLYFLILKYFKRKCKRDRKRKQCDVRIGVSEVNGIIKLYRVQLYRHGNGL
jgi:hypothetical protein